MAVSSARMTELLNHIWALREELGIPQEMRQRPRGWARGSRRRRLALERWARMLEKARDNLTAGEGQDDSVG